MQKFNPAIWQELGVTQWQTRPGFEDLAAKIKQIESRPASTDFLQQPDLTNPAEAVAPAPGLVEATAQAEQAAPIAQLAPQQKPWVLIGDGLQANWQNQAGLNNNQAWLLWQNIMNYHLETPAQMVFFDTEQISSEDAGFDVVDKLSELGAEQVFSMNSEHFLHEFLQEAIQVVSLPSFDQMLEQPQLKADVFQALNAYFKV